MGIDFDENKPIYQQLMNRISGEIVRGERKTGGKLSSVRDYALEVGVNVNTIQRVYRELERQDIVKTKRGQGTFVTENQELLAALREKMKGEVVRHFIKDMKEMGYCVEEMINSVEKEGQ